MTQDRWQRAAEWPLTVIAVVFLVAYSWEIIADLHGVGLIVTETISWVSWALFAIDYVIMLWLAKPRRRWFIRNLHELAMVALPILRPLRLLRLLVILRVLQRSAGTAFRGRILIYAGGSASLLVYVAALAEVDVERGHGGHITNIGNALWWAFVTITTVGYGDEVPVTAYGRIIAVAVMLGGIALLGIVTATLASWVVERVSADDERKQAATKAHIDEVMKEVRLLRAEFAAQNRVDAAAQPEQPPPLDPAQ